MLQLVFSLSFHFTVAHKYFFFFGGGGRNGQKFYFEVLLQGF